MSTGPSKELENILSDTVRMVRLNWKAPICLFLQKDDEGFLRVRAGDGVEPKRAAQLVIKPTNGLLAKCLANNQVLESASAQWDDGLAALLDSSISSHNKKFIVVPVAGESRVFGALILGPYPLDQDMKSHEIELRSSGTLCAVLSAHLRIYQWLSNFMPNFNHTVRTPLTAIQGSLGMVLGGMFGEVSTDVRQMLEMAHRGCERTVHAMEEFVQKQITDKSEEKK